MTRVLSLVTSAYSISFCAKIIPYLMIMSGIIINIGFISIIKFLFSSPLSNAALVQRREGNQGRHETAVNSHGLIIYDPPVHYHHCCLPTPNCAVVWRNATTLSFPSFSFQQNSLFNPNSMRYTSTAVL